METTAKPVNPAISHELTTANELAPLIRAKNGNAVLRLARQGKIPAIRLGHRTVFFSPAAVMAAIGAR